MVCSKAIEHQERMPQTLDIVSWSSSRSKSVDFTENERTGGVSDRRVRPEQVAQCAFRWELAVPVDRVDRFEGRQVGGDASVDAKDAASRRSHKRSDWERLEARHKVVVY